LGTGLNPAAGLCPFDNSPEARYSLSAVPMFSPQFLEQVRAASDIVDVIGGALPLKRAGANFVTLCPFHKEKSPSFNVNPGKQIFHCFGCHKGGDVFTFVREYEGLNFSEAVVVRIDLTGALGAESHKREL
jgi:DNA primase